MSERTRSEEMIQQVFTCSVCGQPKVHHRLYGYRCSNPEHNEDVQNLIADMQRDHDKWGESLEREFKKDSQRPLRAMRSGKHSHPPRRDE